MGSNTAVCLPLSSKKQHICVSFSNSCGLIQRWLIVGTYRFLLSTLMVGQPTNRKGASESLKGDESFRICNPSNWSSWHLLLTWYHAWLVDSALLHHIHSFLAAWCIIVLYCHFSFSHHVLLELLHFRKCMHDKEHERHLLLTYHQLIPPFSVVTPSKPQVTLCGIIGEKN